MAHLLLVDNDARITDLTAWFLKRAGHEVRCVESYAAARELLREQRPDLLLADLDLGEESGREELPRLAAEGILPKTLVVSGFLDATIAEELLRIPGVVGTVAKPFEMDGLQAEIERWTSAEVPEVREAAADSAVEGTPVAAVEETEDDDDEWVEIVPYESAPRAGEERLA